MLTKKHALDDDFESPRNVVTESNVDYLSYKFDEMDLAASWRVLTKQKLNIVNGIRLENASWRTWAKQRNNLKTVSPDTLNWLKDSDVTWLYGPLHTVIKEVGETDRYAKPKVSTTEDTLGLMTTPQKQHKEDNSTKDVGTTSPTSTDNASTPISVSSSTSNLGRRPTASPLQGQKPLKSALKKVTVSDLLKRSASELQINNPMSSSISISEANQQLGAFSPAVIASHRQPKLRFNQYVEQCVALSSDDNSSNKKRNSRVRMAELNDITNDEDDEDETSSDDYEPGDESDAGSVIMMRRSNKLRSSIKKIEPALLKTNSRSDQDSASSSDSSDDEIIRTTSTSGYHKKLHNYHHRNSRRSSSSANNNMDWDVESAESDAFVKHIIRVSKGKQPLGNRDPAADRIPVQQSGNWDDGQITDGGEIQGKSDYDYEFDDDDWDTHSEHAEDVPFTTMSDEYLPPVAPAPPVGCQIAKAPAVNEPIFSLVSPTVERSLSDTKATEEIQQNQQQYDNQGSLSNSNSNSSLFSSIAHWAFSHLWPAENN